MFFKQQNTNRQRRHPARKHQGGQFLVLGALAAFGIVSTLILVGLNTVIMRRAVQELRVQADVIARSLLTHEVTYQRGMVYAFIARLEERTVFGPIENARIVGATLIAPTMPKDTEVFDPSDISNAVTTFLKNEAGGDVSASKIVSIESLGLPGITCPIDSCKYRFNVDWSGKYPTHLWSNLENAGNTAGVELEAKVDLLWVGTKDISVRSAYWKLPRGYFPDYVPFRKGFKIAEAHGLTVAIATHLTTDKDDIRFRFRYDNPDDLDEAEFPEQDPLYEDAFAGDYWYNTPGFFPSFNDTPGPFTTNRTHPLGWYVAEPTSPISNLEHRKDMRAACMNPAVLARNLFLQTIVELASRNGHLRRGTEILHIGTQNRNVSAVTAVPLGGLTGPVTTNSIPLNGPVEIVRFGEDLTEDNYQIPYISYYGKVATADLRASDKFGVNRDMPINPLIPSGGPGPSPTDPLLSLISAQLRHCYFLYHDESGHTGYNGGIEFIDPVGSANDKFEDLDTYPAPQSKQATNATPGTGWGWDQLHPFDPNNGAAEGVTAAELVGMLGSTQRCPYPSAGGCSKEALISGTDANEGTYDLRPDMVGLMTYLAGAAGCPAGLNVTRSKALPAPGIHPYLGTCLNNEEDNLGDLGVIDDSCGDIPGSMYEVEGGADNLLPTNDPINIRTPILIVTHQRLTKDEARAIRRIYNKCGFNQRHITVVYFPYRWIDVTYDDPITPNSVPDTIDNFRHAFNIPAEPHDRDNALYVLDPYSVGRFRLTDEVPNTCPLETGSPATLATNCECCIDKNADEQCYCIPPGSTTSPEDNFLSFWLDISNPQGGSYMVGFAQAIFYRLMNVEKKF